jgi:hypothetical protein
MIVLGPEALNYSIEKNASSKWSAVDMKKNWGV